MEKIHERERMFRRFLSIRGEDAKEDEGAREGESERERL